MEEAAIVASATEKFILYVEDSLDTADAVKFLLKSAGIGADTAKDGKEGLQKAMERKYDLVLLDVMLPDMSGWDIYDQLKKSNYPAKYAFISGIPISGERFKELQVHGVEAYILKPFKKEEFVQKMRKILEIP